MPIYYAFIDFDGCGGHQLISQETFDAFLPPKNQASSSSSLPPQLTAEALKKSIQEKHAALIEYLKKQIPDYGKKNIKIASGSNRQAFYLDMLNTCHNSSLISFYVFQAYAEILGVEYYDLLLADLLANKKDTETTVQQIFRHLGDSPIYHQADVDFGYQISDAASKNISKAFTQNPTHFLPENLEAAHPLSTCPVAYVDENKIVMLFAHLQHLALKDSQEEITVDFIDDKLLRLEQPAILLILKDFYEKNPKLLPKNITLNIFHYDATQPNAQPKKIATIQGQGECIPNHLEIAQDYLILSRKKEEPEFATAAQRKAAAKCEDFQTFIDNYPHSALADELYKNNLIECYNQCGDRINAILNPPQIGFWDKTVSTKDSNHIPTFNTDIFNDDQYKISLLETLQNTPLLTYESLIVHCQALIGILNKHIEAFDDARIKQALSKLVMQANRLALYLTHSDTEAAKVNMRTKLLTFLDGVLHNIHQYQTSGCQLIQREFAAIQYQATKNEKTVEDLFNLYTAVQDIAYDRLMNLRAVDLTKDFYEIIVSSHNDLFNPARTKTQLLDSQATFSCTPETPVFRS